MTHTPTDLTAAVRQALETSTTDDQLARALASDPILLRVLAQATLTEEQVNDVLGYAPDTLRAIARKSKTFPAPVLSGKRWRTAEIQAYRQTHARNSG